MVDNTHGPFFESDLKCRNPKHLVQRTKHIDDHLNGEPFEIRASNSSVFQCFWYSNGQYSDPHCSLVFRSPFFYSSAFLRGLLPCVRTNDLACVSHISEGAGTVRDLGPIYSDLRDPFATVELDRHFIFHKTFFLDLLGRAAEKLLSLTPICCLESRSTLYQDFRDKGVSIYVTHFSII